MLRLIFIGVISWLIYVFYKKMLKRAKRQTGQAGRVQERQGSAATAVPGEMVACAKCQTFVLRNEAIEKKGRFYCSQGCAN